MGENKDSVLTDESENKKESYKNNAVNISSGVAAGQAAAKSVQQAAKTYAKPESYAGNRQVYDNGMAKANAKKNIFNDEKIVIDPYTGKKLVLTKTEAKQLYGSKWSEHLAESDHIKPLGKIYEDTKNNQWNSTEDIKRAANSDENIRVVSRKYNNAKRSRTNEEYVNNEEYLKEKGVQLTKEGKQQALVDGKIAEQSINRQLQESAVKNVIKTGHEAGKAGAKNAAVTTVTISGIMNVVSVIEGEKSADEAIVDTIKDGGKAAAMGYGISGGTTILSHTFEKSSEFIRGLCDSNVPGKVITAVIVTGETLKKWGDGEITTEECILELGEKGLNCVTMGYSMAVGQALIPIPIVGGAVGALVGSLLTSSYYNALITKLQNRQLEHEERLRIIEECQKAAEQTKEFRYKLEKYFNDYFQDMKDCFDSALSSMHVAFETGDTYGIVASANEITKKLGGIPVPESTEETKKILKSGWTI